MERRRESVARGPFHTTPIFVKRAHGARLEDVDGNELIDFAAGIGVVNTGHTNERVVNAIKSQAEELLHGSFNVTAYESYIELCEKLNEATPGSFKKKSFLANSGAESVENSIKIARAFTGKTSIVCFDHAFHGRTYMAMSLTYKEKPYKAGFGPFMSDVKRAPYPYSYRFGKTEDESTVSTECFEQFLKVVDQNTAAVIIEPVLGEGGFVPAPKKFLAMLRHFCTEKNIVLIADEIQTGFGRTGTLFASEQLDFVPDLILTAKGLGGGMPISAVTGRADIMDSAPEGGIGGTFGGNPVSCAAALAVFEVIEKDDLLRKSRELGVTIQERLQSFLTSKFVGQIRGLGPMQAIEFVKDKATKEPNSDAAKHLVKFCYEHGLVIMTAGSLGNVVRLLMPLTISGEDLKEGLDILEVGIRELI